MPNKFTQLEGSWLPSVDPANIGFDNYKTLTNLRYKPTRGLQVVNGYSAINTVPVGPVADPVFSPSGGTFASPFSLSITSASTDATIYYTTDGTTPTSSSTEYTGDISVQYASTIKAIAIEDNGLSSSVVTEQYLFSTAFLFTSTSKFIQTSDGKLFQIIG